MSDPPGKSKRSATSVGATAVAEPHTYLGWGLAAAMLCFLPLGLVTLYYGLRVSRALADGDQDKARHDSRVAKRWLIATVITGLLVYAFIALVLALLGAFSN